ncbi:MAG: hypothetical protein AVDCRST_MAG57-1698, partial [uncultured Blastococcus sp.]
GGHQDRGRRGGQHGGGQHHSTAVDRFRVVRRPAPVRAGDRDCGDRRGHRWFLLLHPGRPVHLPRPVPRDRAPALRHRSGRGGHAVVLAAVAVPPRPLRLDPRPRPGAPATRRRGLPGVGVAGAAPAGHGDGRSQQPAAGAGRLPGRAAVRAAGVGGGRVHRAGALRAPHRLPRGGRRAGGGVPRPGPAVVARRRSGRRAPAALRGARGDRCRGRGAVLLGPPPARAGVGRRRGGAAGGLLGVRHGQRAEPAAELGPGQVRHGHGRRLEVRGGGGIGGHRVAQRAVRRPVPRPRRGGRPPPADHRAGGLRADGADRARAGRAVRLVQPLRAVHLRLGPPRAGPAGAGPAPRPPRGPAPGGPRRGGGDGGRAHRRHAVRARSGGGADCGGGDPRAAGPDGAVRAGLLAGARRGQRPGLGVLRRRSVRGGPPRPGQRGGPDRAADRRNRVDGAARGRARRHARHDLFRRHRHPGGPGELDAGRRPHAGRRAGERGRRTGDLLRDLARRRRSPAPQPGPVRAHASGERPPGADIGAV